VLIGDVSGHGVKAARLANLTKDVIRAFTGVSSRPNDVLARANRLLLEEDFTGFVTVFLGMIDNERAGLRYASAGHPDVILRRASGEMHSLRGHSMPLGVHSDAAWISKLVETRPGDLLLLYTDGVTEARRDGELFGEDRLHDLIEKDARPVDELPQAILDAVLEFSDDKLRDDLAIMAVSLGEGAIPAAG
jgi:phosphoserine phosphatase RsbU/P